MEVASASAEHQRRFMLNLPPGYHFAPTEDELIVHYLRRKIAGLQPLLPIFFDVDNLNSYRPEQIVDKYREHGEDCWYFFTKRVRKYSTGNHPNRTTPGKGFWKATGPQRLIHVNKELVGRVRTLVFYTEPEKEEQVAPGVKEMDDQTALPKLAKTNWIMYEYENLTSQAEAEDKNIDKIDEWVLCTIHKSRRCNGIGKEKGEDDGGKKIKEKGEIDVGGKKRKGKEKMEAEKGIDQGQQQTDGLMKILEVPISPPHLETAAPEEEDGSGIEFEDSGPPQKRLPVARLQPQEPPHTKTTSPFIADSCYSICPNMAPTTQWPQEPPRSETTFPPVAVGSAGSTMTSMTTWQGQQLSQVSSFVGDAYNFDPRLEPGMAYPPAGYNYNVAPPNMATYPLTNLRPDAATAPPRAYGYGGSVPHTVVGALDGLLSAANTGHDNNIYQLCSYAAGTKTTAIYMNSGTASSQSHDGFFAGSSQSQSQHHSVPSVLGAGRAVRPAAAQDLDAATKLSCTCLPV